VGFSDARKIQKKKPGLNPRTRVPVASMLTTRQPKPSGRQVDDLTDFIGCVAYTAVSYEVGLKTGLQDPEGSKGIALLFL
jgi:hypothetical protein